MLRIMVDLDGVLSNFVLAFTTLANTLFGKEIHDTHQHTAWTWPPGYITGAEEMYLWDVIQSTPNWWRDALEPLATLQEFGRLNELGKKYPVHYVTARVHDDSVVWQTAEWLKKYGVSNASVINEGRKAKVAAALDITHSLEDRYEHYRNIHLRSNALSYILDAPYNRDEDTFKGSRLKTVSEFLDILENRDEEMCTIRYRSSQHPIGHLCCGEDA